MPHGRGKGYSATRGPESENRMPTKPRKYPARHQVIQVRNQGFFGYKGTALGRAAPHGYGAASDRHGLSPASGMAADPKRGLSPDCRLGGTRTGKRKTRHSQARAAKAASQQTAATAANRDAQVRRVRTKKPKRPRDQGRAAGARADPGPVPCLPGAARGRAEARPPAAARGIDKGRPTPRLPCHNTRGDQRPDYHAAREGERLLID